MFRDVGDGAGYDIRSFDPATGQERLIEVKSTYGGETMPFFIPRNEDSLSLERPKQLRLYRVFDFAVRPRLFDVTTTSYKHLFFAALLKELQASGFVARVYSIPSFAFAVGLPDKAHATSLIDGAGNVADAILGPRDAVFGTAILGTNYAHDVFQHPSGTPYNFDVTLKTRLEVGVPIGADRDPTNEAPLCAISMDCALFEEGSRLGAETHQREPNARQARRN